MKNILFILLLVLFSCDTEDPQPCKECIMYRYVFYQNKVTHYTDSATICDPIVKDTIFTSEWYAGDNLVKDSTAFICTIQ